MKKLIKCLNCKKEGVNQFSDPYDQCNISPFHSKRSDTEYYYKCPYCNSITIFPSEPK